MLLWVNWIHLYSRTVGRRQSHGCRAVCGSSVDVHGHGHPAQQTHNLDVPPLRSEHERREPFVVSRGVRLALPFYTTFSFTTIYRKRRIIHSVNVDPY
jgi:hypothetical protein